MIPQPAKSLSTQYVECVRNDKGVDVASREVKTPVFTSKKGARAFGVVAAAKISPGGCQNRTTLYLAQPHGSFQLVYQQGTELTQDGSIYDGNGIEAIRWSPSGKRVLIQISQWIWGSDFGENTKYVVTTGNRKARVISPAEAVWKQFKQPCTARIQTHGWIDDDRIQVDVNPFVDTDEEGVRSSIPSCVKGPVKFSFGVDTGSLHMLAAAGSR
jgi:hypothetical protein